MDAPPVQYARTSDGVSIAFISLGQGPPVVFASNIFGDANYYRLGLLGYRELPDQLVASGFRAIVMDVRGMGSSDRKVPDVSVDAWTKDVEAVSRHLGLQRFALYGSDLGAATAIAYAYKHPEQVSHLILLRPWRNWQQRADAQGAIQMIRTMRPENDQQWVAASKFIASLATSFQADSDEVAKVASAIQNACSSEQYIAHMDAPVGVDLTDLLPALKAPTMVLHVPNMILAAYEDSRDVAARISDARFMEYNPPHTLPLVVDFLRGAKATATGVASDHGTSGLSAREIEVLRLLAAGKSNAQIAEELVISQNTVIRHVSNIFAKIDVANRAEAASYATRQGLA